MSDWDFGGAYANTAGALQQQDQSRQAFPLNLQHLEATTRLNNAQAGIMENRAAADKAMKDIMSGMTLDPKASGSATVMQLAGVAMKAGDPVTARELVLRATQARTQEAHEQALLAQQQKFAADVRIKMADRYNQLLGGVNSQEDLDKANMIWQSEFGEPAPQMTYDPRTVDMLRQSTVKMRDKILQDHNIAMERLRSTQIGNTKDYRDGLLDLRAQENERRKAADLAREKNGGKDVGAPSKAELDNAKDVMEREGKTQGLDTASARSAAFDLASRARALRRSNPGLDAGEATQRALLQQISEGYYTTKKATSVLGIPLGKDKTSYGRPGGSADRAAEVPADRSTMKAQTYYRTPKGNLLYLGGGKWQVPEPAKAPAGASPEDDDEEE